MIIPFLRMIYSMNRKDLHLQWHSRRTTVTRNRFSSPNMVRLSSITTLGDRMKMESTWPNAEEFLHMYAPRKNWISTTIKRTRSFCQFTRPVSTKSKPIKRSLCAQTERTTCSTATTVRSKRLNSTYSSSSVTRRRILTSSAKVKKKLRGLFGTSGSSCSITRSASTLVTTVTRQLSRRV